MVVGCEGEAFGTCTSILQDGDHGYLEIGVLYTIMPREAQLWKER